MLLNRRWWDLAVAVGSIVIAIGLLTEFRADGQWRLGVGLAGVGMFVFGYLFIGRGALGAAPGWRFPAFVVVAAVAVGAGSGAAGFVATLQALAYPLAWVIGGGRRRGIAGSIVIASAVACGIAVGGGLNGGAILAGLATGGFSLGFSVAFGLWIVSITEYGEQRDRLLTELRAAQSEVEALSRERGASQERERFARDIHDTLAQTLAGLVILAERAGRLWRDGQVDAAATAIATVEQSARDALAEARALVARTAAVPREPAFGAAIERLVERFRSQGGAAIELDLGSRAEDEALERDAQVVLLRCVQEALSNVSKHANATRVRVRVAVRAGGAAELHVSDDGAGFDPSEARPGFGLDGMSDRVGLAGGRFEVESAPGSGTTLSVWLPGERAAS